jgi:hypothetical protein
VRHKRARRHGLFYCLVTSELKFAVHKFNKQISKPSLVSCLELVVAVEVVEALRVERATHP